MKKADIMKKQLGMPQGTAANKLRKEIMFDLVKKLNLNKCYQCNEIIETSKEFSIEHIKPWLHEENAKELFFDLENIAFSHLSCNCGAGTYRLAPKHPSITAYYKGCRCDECKNLKKEENKRNRKKNIS